MTEKKKKDIKRFEKKMASSGQPVVVNELKQKAKSIN